MEKMTEFRKIAVIGGAGHVGLPMAIHLANIGFHAHIFDTNKVSLDLIAAGQMPFFEVDGQQELAKALDSGNLSWSSDPQTLSDCDTAFFVLGTGVDADGKPETSKFIQLISALLPNLTSMKYLVLRSTVAIGTTKLLTDLLMDFDIEAQVFYCPERIAEHKALQELKTLPQIISSYSQVPSEVASLFNSRGGNVFGSPEEAEFAKLVSNAWRYVKFAFANEMYMAASRLSLDYEIVRQLVSKDYPRARDLPKAGFAGGPCLPKDSQQLMSSVPQDLHLLEAAHATNEARLVQHLCEEAERRLSGIHGKAVLVLGYSFKPNSDDVRGSVSRLLVERLCKSGARVSVHDYLCAGAPLPPDASWVQDLRPEEFDLVIVAMPHKDYAALPLNSHSTLRFA